MANDIILGAKIQIDTGGSTQAITSTVKGMNDMGNAAKNAQAQFATLSKQAQQSAQSFVSLSNALGMNKAAEIAKNALEAQKAMGMLGAAALAGNKAVAASAGSSSNIMAALTGNLKAAGAEMDKTAAKSESASKKMVAANEKVGLSIRGWLPHMRTAAASIGIYFGVRAVANVIRLADSYTDMTSRLKLVSGTTQELTRAQEGLFRIAQSNRAPLAETANLYYKLAVSMKEYGAAQKDVLGVVDTVGKAMRISGASTIETGAAMMQLAQAFAKGKLDGDEFRSVMENAPRLMKALTDEFKISKEELYRWSETGTLSVERMMEALKNQSATIEREFSTIPITISGAWTQLSNAALKYLGDADQANGTSKELAQTISELSEKFNRLADVVSAVLNPILAGVIAIVDVLNGAKIAVTAVYDALSTLTATEALKWFLAPDIKAWTVVKEALGLAVTKSRDGFNEAISKDTWLSRRGKDGVTAYSTAEGFLGMSETKNAESLVKFLNEHSGTVFENLTKPWCARFVSASLDAAGIKGAPQTARARDFLGFGESVWEPSKGVAGLSALQQGDIAIFSRGGAGSGQGHVAFVKSADINKGTVSVLGGNQGNAVSIDERGIDKLLGVRRVTGAYFDGNNTMAKAMQGLTDIQTLIFKTATQYKINPALMLGLAQQESTFNPAAVNSKDGGRGLFQFMQDTWESVQTKAKLPTDYNDAFDPKKSADAAARLLVELQGIFKDNIPAIIAAYNAGPRAVQKAIRENQDIASVATKGHVGNVLSNMQNWTGVLAGNPEISETNRQAYLKDFEKLQKEQYDAVVERLKLQEQATDIHYKQQAEKQRTYMTQLEADRAAAAERNKSAITTATPLGGRALQDALKKEETDRLAFEERKKKAALDGLVLDDKITQNKIANLKKQIEEAKKAERFTEVPALQQDLKSEEAQLKINAERRVQLTLEADARIRESRRDLDQDSRSADRQAADDYAAMQRNRIEGLQAEFAIQKQLAEASVDAFAQWGDSQKAAIDLTLEGARANLANRDAERQSLAEGKQGLDLIAQNRENLNAKLADTLSLLQQEYDANVQKLNIDRQALEYEKAIAEWQAQQVAVTDPNNQSALISARKAIADLEYEIAQNMQAQGKAAAVLATEQAKARTEAAKTTIKIDTQEVKESQLRMNAFWDQYMQRLTDYASLWQEITGETQNGFTKMSLAMGEYAKQTAQISQYFENNPNAFGDFTGAIEGIQQGQAALAAMAKTMLALRSNYKEGTQGYKDMTSAAERMMEVQQALQVVEGVLAVIHQLSSGDVYTAIPRALGVAAMIASLGIQTGASGSAGMSNSAAQQAARAGGSTAAGGGVFGDTSAKSDSIAKSLSIIAENSSVDLSYSAGMYRALKNIEAAMGGVTNSIIRGVGPAEIPGLGTKGLLGNSGKIGGAVLFGPIGYGLGVIGDAISKILFNVTKKITDWGIKALPQSFSDILAKGFQGMNFTEVTTTTKVLFMTVSKKVKEYTTDLNSEVGKQITLTILNMADAVKEAGKAFGISGDKFTEKMGNFVIDFGRFSTKGLKGQELKDAVGQMFSTMSDDMAQYFSTQFNLGLEPFQQAGEGMFETLMRVSNGINVATGLLAQAGLEAIKYQQIVLKQGDVAAEIVRQSIVKFEGIDTALGRYIDGAVGTAEDLMSVYDSLLQIREIAPFVAFNFENLSQAMVVTSGGVSNLLKNLKTYQEKFHPGTQLASDVMVLQSRMAKLGLTMPTSRNAFMQLVEAQDDTTVAGQKLKAQLWALAGAFDAVFSQVENADELLKKYLPTDALSGFRDQIRQVGDDFKTIIAATLATMPGGAEFMSLSQQKTNVTNNLISRQTAQASTYAKLDLVNEEIFVLQAKDKLTKEERKRLQVLKGERRTLTSTLREVTGDIAKYKAQLAKIDEKLAKNPGSAQLAAKRAELIEKQGDALIKTISDIWDQMTQAINQAKETLKSIQDSIFELAGGMGGESIKYGMANARRIAAESAYKAYTGNDINQLNKLSSDYYRAIMDEYNAKMELIEAPKKALEKERELRQKAHDEEISALEKTLGKTQELNDAIKAIQKYALDLKLGSQSTLSPEQRLAEAQKQYAALLARAQGGDVNAMQELASGATNYLEAAQKYYGSNSQYATIFDGVQKAMESLGAMNPGDADSIQAKIDQLNKDHEIYLKSIDEQIAALNIDQQIKDLQAATVAKLQLLADDLGPRITEAEQQAAEDMKILIAEIMSSNVFNERQLDTLREIAKSMGITLPEYNGGGGGGGDGTPPTPGTDFGAYDGPAAYTGWNQYWRQAQIWWKNHFKKEMTWAAFKQQTYEDLKAQGMHPVLPKFANGGFAQAGMALVGERGPEIVRFERPAQVMTADETREALSGSPKTFKALEDIKTELAALVTTQSGANPEIIKELRELRSRMDSIERTSRLKA